LKFTQFLFASSLLFLSGVLYSQNKLNQFFTPSDSINTNRVKTVIITETALTASTLVALHTLWYKNYPQSNFHFINDNNEWLQMDKMGHVFASYQIGSASVKALKWAGVSEKKQLIYGSTLGFTFLTVVEIFDGYSSQWGASSGDLIANTLGTGLYLSQALLWKEQRIVPKFSFHTNRYAALRPNVLGSNFSEQILKDYNGQTYWLSVNLKSFIKKSNIPDWLNLAIGYGGEGMITGTINSENNFLLPNEARRRQFYVSLDLDLTRIKTKSATLKTLFNIINVLKIPAPTLEINSQGKTKGFIFYY
jgi:Predicted periplasmic lipoprotein (DUF2279)